MTMIMMQGKIGEKMDDKEKKLIQRYIDGEKQLISKLTEIFASTPTSETCSYYLFLKYLFDDDQQMFIHKREIQKDISHKGLKPNFPKNKPTLPPQQKQKS